MNRIEKKCLTASFSLHLALLGILLLAPAFSRPEPPGSATPVLEILPADLKLTMDGTVRGGSPPTEPPRQSAPVPPAAPAAANQPKPEPPKPEPTRKVVVAQEPVRSAPKPQDQEPGRKPEKRIENDPVAADAKGAKPGIKVSTAKISPTDAERKKREAAERESAAAAERERVRKGAERIAKLLGQSESNLKSGLSSTTEITMPGPGGGGPVYADYLSYLQTVYQAQWNRRKPSNVSVKVAVAKARITVSRDGIVTAHSLFEPSGINAVDEAVGRVLNECKQLKSIPAEAKGSEITVTITFKVEGDSSA
jgi:outer membrane biosynthesis protein TonB